MNTILDGTAAWLWFPESAEYKDRELRLVLAEATVSAGAVEIELLPGTTMSGLNPLVVPVKARRFLVRFEDVRLLHIIEDTAHKAQPTEHRETGVVARHHNSALLQWLAKSTYLTENILGELFHYSVETAEDFYHVVTRMHPTVSEIEA